MWITKDFADRLHRVTFHCISVLIDAVYCTQQEDQKPGVSILIPSLSSLIGLSLIQNVYPSSSLIVLRDCHTTNIQNL